jgi:hypothetical protein
MTDLSKLYDTSLLVTVHVCLPLHRACAEGEHIDCPFLA